MKRALATLAAIAWAGIVLGDGPPTTPTPSAALGDPVTLDVKDADLREVLLRKFASKTRLNLVLDPEVKGSVTVRFDRIPFEQALDAVLASNGWGWTVEGRILRVGNLAKL